MAKEPIFELETFLTGALVGALPIFYAPYKWSILGTASIVVKNHFEYNSFIYGYKTGIVITTYCLYLINNSYVQNLIENFNKVVPPDEIINYGKIYGFAAFTTVYDIFIMPALADLIHTRLYPVIEGNIASVNDIELNGEAPFLKIF